LVLGDRLLAAVGLDRLVEDGLHVGVGGAGPGQRAEHHQRGQHRQQHATHRASPFDGTNGGTNGSPLRAEGAAKRQVESDSWPNDYEVFVRPDSPFIGQLKKCPGEMIVRPSGPEAPNYGSSAWRTGAPPEGRPYRPTPGVGVS